MPYLPYMYELSPLYLLQAAMTIWMLTDANKRGVDRSWFWIILAFQPFGAWAYFFIYKAKDIQGGSGIFGNLGNLFHRPPSLAEHLLDTGDKGEARRIVDRGLEDYRYLSGPSRRRDGRWVGKAKQLLKQID